MRIAQVAPPFESVPPARYGGTERVVSTLTEELVRSGHDVTLSLLETLGPLLGLSPWPLNTSGCTRESSRLTRRRQQDCGFQEPMLDERDLRSVGRGSCRVADAVSSVCV